MLLSSPLEKKEKRKSGYVMLPRKWLNTYLPEQKFLYRSGDTLPPRKWLNSYLPDSYLPDELTQKEYKKLYDIIRI